MPPRIKESPEDFVVEEIPAYEACGEGDHLFVTFEKRLLTTDEAVAKIAAALDVSRRDVGIAGMKDKVGVTTQTVSFPFRAGLDDAAMALAIPGIKVLAARRHTNKLKTGHLAGNRFVVMVRGMDAAERAHFEAALEAIRNEGVPNAFGEQRFGRAGDNAERARAWLSGDAPPPRDKRLARLLFSSLQSHMFNAVLARREEEGTWATALEGDLLKKHDTGGLFPCTDVAVDRERAARGEVSATGPLFGVKMRRPTGAPSALEDDIFAALVGNRVDLSKTSRLGEGTRRALRLWVAELTSELQGDSVRVRFVLPKGAYATTVISRAAGGKVESGPPTRDGNDGAGERGAADDVTPDDDDSASHSTEKTDE